MTIKFLPLVINYECLGLQKIMSIESGRRSSWRQTGLKQFPWSHEDDASSFKIHQKKMGNMYKAWEARMSLSS